MEITKTEYDAWMAEYGRRGYVLTLRPGPLDQTYLMANGNGHRDARVARISPTGLIYLDNPLIDKF